MMIVPAIAVAATASVTVASVRNMLQTFLSVQKDRDISDEIVSLRRLRNDPAPSSSHRVVSTLSKMSRKESLELFLSSTPPANLASIQGDWSGVLLLNNAVLTVITRFITNALFGKGKTWNGKSFASTNHTGMNRFRVENVEPEGFTIRKRHQFDYSIAPSRLADRGRPSSSVRLVYKRYQASPLSLWYTMVDEVRLVPMPRNSPCEVLIGMGSMAWSGGMLNASPFLLWRKRNTK